MGWRWQVNWVSSFYRGETDPEQAEGRGCWPGGSSEESQPGTSRGHTVSWAPLEGPMAASSRVPLQGWVSSGGQVSKGTPAPSVPAPLPSHTPRALGAAGWRKPRSPLRLPGGAAPAQHPGQHLVLCLRIASSRPHFGFSGVASVLIDVLASFLNSPCKSRP